MYIIEHIQTNMNISEFTETFPHINLSKGNRKDYDPGFWRKKIQFCLFGSHREVIRNIEFSIFITFYKERLHFLQYFGRIHSDRKGFTKVKNAFLFLEKACIRLLGNPSDRIDFPEYTVFMAKPRISDGMPDDRNVRIAFINWNGKGSLCANENVYSRIVIDFRLEVL